MARFFHGTFPDGVLITRAPDSAADTARRLNACGWRPVFAPVAEIDRTGADMPPPEDVQAVLVTSANAVGMLPTSYLRLPLLAVGDATASRARALGFIATRSASGDALALAALAAETCVPSHGPLLHVCARDAPQKLGQVLTEAGFTVTRREVYFARPAARLPEAAREEFARNMVAATLFFSPATARTFVALFQEDMALEAVANVIAIAISEAAAEALSPLPWRRIRVASRPNQDELLAQLP